MRRNETLTQSVRRFEGDIEVLERNYALEEEKQKKLNETLNQVANSVEFTQMDLNSAIAVSVFIVEIFYSTLIKNIFYPTGYFVVINFEICNILCF